MVFNSKALVTNCKILMVKENEMIGNDGKPVKWYSVSFMQDDGISQDITCDKEVYPLLHVDSKADLIVDIQGEKKQGFTSLRCKIIGIANNKPKQ